MTAASLSHPVKNTRQDKRRTWFAKMSETFVLSPASLRMFLAICSIGVMPVPPAIMPMCFTGRMAPPPGALAFFTHSLPRPCRGKQT